MTKGRILVVDDSPTDLRILTAPLKSEGYEVLTAVDGDDALLKANRDHPDLIVLDVILPKKNGYQVCRELKNAEETKDIKIIMLTSKSLETDRYWGMKQGADLYMTKPFRDAELVSSVGNLL